MAQPARYLNNILGGIALCSYLSACNAGNSTKNTVYLSTDSVELQHDKAFYQHKPFSGILYTLPSSPSDTLALLSYKDGLRQGLWKQFYPSGQIKEERFFEKGRKEGECKQWHSNGKLKLHCFFQKGDYEGQLEEWNDKGVLIKQMHYHQGQEEGAQKQFYDDGKIRANYVIKNGKRYGLLGTKNCINVSDSAFR